jgi:hypothetical protein
VSRYLGNTWQYFMYFRFAGPKAFKLFYIQSSGMLHLHKYSLFITLNCANKRTGDSVNEVTVLLCVLRKITDDSKTKL